MVSVVHLAYFVVNGGFEVFIVAFCRRSQPWHFWDVCVNTCFERSVQGAPPCVLSRLLFVMQKTLSHQYKRRFVINAESTLKCLSRIKDTHWNSIPKWSIAVISARSIHSLTLSSYTFFPFYAAAVLPTSLDAAEKFAGVRKIPRDGLELFASWSVKPLVYQRRFSSTGHGL